jgi:hypothetical protein
MTTAEIEARAAIVRARELAIMTPGAAGEK